MRFLPPKPTLAILTLATLMKAPDAMPAFKNYKVLDWQSIPAVLDFTPRKRSAAPIEDEQLRMHPDKDAASYKIFRVNDPWRSLDHFFEALYRTETRQPGAVTRIVHYGDSPTTADLITGDTRKLLQGRFGDAGHGFVLLAKPWAWYDHNGVNIQDSGWTIDPATQSKLRNGLFGLGGVTFRGDAGTHTNLTLKDSNHTTLEVSYLRQPGGGIFQVSAEGRVLATVDTKGRTVEAGYSLVDIPPNSRHFEIRVARPESGPSEVVGQVSGSRVPNGPAYIQVYLSPDGKWLASPLLDGTTTNVWALSTAGRGWRKLTDFGSRNVDIRRRIGWSKDGKHMYVCMSDVDADIVMLTGLKW